MAIQTLSSKTIHEVTRREFLRKSGTAFTSNVSAEDGHGRHPITRGDVTARIEMK
jgi:hypothetical protein